MQCGGIQTSFVPGGARSSHLPPFISMGLAGMQGGCICRDPSLCGQRCELHAPAPASVTGSPHLTSSHLLISLCSHPPTPRRIFIFADPELLSEAICNALVTDTQAARLSQSPRACMCYVIIHAMQAALGEGCDLSGLRMSLQVTSSTSTAPRMVF